jgi:uncharacterized protein YoxC
MALKIGDDEILGQYNDPRSTRVDRALLLGIYNTGLLQELLKQLEKVMATIEELQAAVAKIDTAIDGTIALVKKLREDIAAAGVDPAKLDAVVADLGAHEAALEALKTAPPA